MKAILVTTLILCSSLVQAQDYEKIFRCYTPINPMDPNFQQGSEVFVDVYYNKEEEKSYVVSKPAVGPDVVIYQAEEIEKTRFDMKGSTIFLSWIHEEQRAYTSMVYMGENLWGAIMQLSELAKLRDPSLNNKVELELYCRETRDLLEYLNN